MYIDSVFNFTGSKFKLLNQIIPHLDKSKKTFVDLFTGGGSVYMNVLDIYDSVIANEIIKELIEIHEKLLNNDQIIQDVKKLCVDKNDSDGFLKLRESFNENKSPEKLWALMLCSTNNMMRFNQKFKYNQTFGKRTFNPNTEKKLEIYKNNIRKHKDKIFFLNKNFNDVDIPKNSMIYIDPPYGYIDNNGYIGNKQISEAGYNAYYTKQDDINLYEYIKRIDEIGSSFMISGLLEHNGKVSWILNRLIEDGYLYKELIYDYYKVSRQKNVDKKSKEIIIMNYE